MSQLYVHICANCGQEVVLNGLGDNLPCPNCESDPWEACGETYGAEEIALARAFKSFGVQGEKFAPLAELCARYNAFVGKSGVLRSSAAGMSYMARRLQLPVITKQRCRGINVRQKAVCKFMRTRLGE